MDVNRWLCYWESCMCAWLTEKFTTCISTSMNNKKDDGAFLPEKENRILTQESKRWWVLYSFEFGTQHVRLERFLDDILLPKTCIAGQLCLLSGAESIEFQFRCRLSRSPLRPSSNICYWDESNWKDYINIIFTSDFHSSDCLNRNNNATSNKN